VLIGKNITGVVIVGMERVEQVLRWCSAEHQKLRRQLATLELSDATAAEISAIRKHLANLDFVLKRLRD
jgi:hypothetical protein